MTSGKLRIRGGEVRRRPTHSIQGLPFYNPASEPGPELLHAAIPKWDRRTATRSVGRRILRSSIGLVVGLLTVMVAFPATEDFERSLASFLATRAQDQFDAGQFDQAARNLQRAIRIEPNDAALRFSLARTEEKLGDYGQALAEDRRAIAIDSRFFPAYLHSAAIYDEKLADYQSSLRVASSAFDQQPRDVSVRYALLTEAGRAAVISYSTTCF